MSHFKDQTHPSQRERSSAANIMTIWAVPVSWETRPRSESRGFRTVWRWRRSQPAPEWAFTPYSALAEESLCASDQLFMDIMSLRLRYLTRPIIRHMPLAPPALDFVGIDLEVQKRWVNSLGALSALLPDSLKLSTPSDLRALLDNPNACQALQERLLKDESSLRTTLALLIAAEVNFSDRDMSWFSDWLIKTLENSVGPQPQDWLEGLLPYAYSAITHKTRVDTSKVEGFRRALARLSR